MKIQILSDLHNEFSPFDPIQTDADVVVLAGDIGRKAEGVQWAAQAFPGRHVVYVPGNHELYQGGREQLTEAMRREAKGLSCQASTMLSDADYSRMHFLNNDEIIIGNVRFLGSTLWTDFELFGEKAKPFCLLEARLYLADFRLIREDGHIRDVDEQSIAFTPEHSIKLHKASLQWLQAKLNECFDGKTVVVTHHLPSMLSVAERYKDSDLSACFASNLDHLFGEQVDLWIHGHTHDSIDYTVNGTRVICNPRGYQRYGTGPENFDFNPVLVVEI